MTLITLAFFASCQLEMSRNKKLDGYWRLQQIDTIGTAGVNKIGGMRIFWAF